MRKTIAMLLLALLLASMFAGCATTAPQTSAPATSNAPASTPAANEPAGPATLLDKPVTLRLLTASAPSWPWQEDWYVQKAIKEKTNVTLDFILTEESTLSDKINTMMAASDVPELTFMLGDLALAGKYGAQGAYVDAMAYLDKMPSFSAWLGSNESYAADYKSAEGKLYALPNQGIGETNRMGWLYRKDVFEKNGLALPTNDMEFYALLKKLKELYPDSYPFSFRDQLGNFDKLASCWGTGFPHYFDLKAKVCKYGPVENNFKLMVQFYNKLYQEKLIPPDFLSIDTKGWVDLMSTDKAFITFDYLGRIDFFNNAVRPTNAAFTLDYMKPYAGGANGTNKILYTGQFFGAFSVSAKTDKLNETLKYVDWLYTAEAKELLSWGEEGKTYNVVDGKKKFIGATDVPTMRKTYGLSTFGYYTLFDYDAHLSLSSPELSAAIMASRDDLSDAMPQVALTDAEQTTFAQLNDSIDKYMNDNISKFILGERPISEWDAYVKELNDMGLQQMLDLETNAYQRQTGSK